MPKSVCDLLLYSLGDLDDGQFKRFNNKLVDSRLGVRRADVQGKDREDVARKLVDTFTKQRALEVTVRLLKEVGYNQVAEDLEKDAAANGYSLSAEAESEARHKAGSADGVSITKTAQTPPTTQTGCSAPQPFFQDDNVTQSQGSGGIAGSGGATGLAGATGSPPGGLDQTDSCSMLIQSSPSFKDAIFKEKGQEVYPVLDKGMRKRLALLINNIDFDVKAMKRNGALRDGVNMEKLLIGLGYEVVKHTNLSGQEIDEALKSFVGRPEHAESDSTFVVIMSHGKRDKILGVHFHPEGKTKPDVFPVDNIYTHLNTVNCPALRNKPKVILIQACRGGLRDPGLTKKGQEDLLVDCVTSEIMDLLKMHQSRHFARKTRPYLIQYATQLLVQLDDLLSSFPDNDSPLIVLGESRESSSENELRRMSSEDGAAWVDMESDDWEHKEKDFIALLSCTPDNKSYRNPVTGALFIKFLVEVFNTNAHKNDVEELFRQIMRKCEEFPLLKQMVCKERTTLGRLFYLFPGL